MTAAATGALPDCFVGFPGGMLQLDPDGIVLGTNGRIDAEVGEPLTGRAFALAVDADSSRDKWERMLAASRSATGEVTAELILASRGELRDPRPFSLLRERDGRTLWLIEHPRDARLDLLRDEVTGVNSELASTQRELFKEQRRLQQALAEQRRLNDALVATTRELERSNRALDEFAHAISHDLKAPLRAVANYGAWVREDLGPATPAGVAQHLGRLDEQVARMRALIDGAIAYARAGRPDGGEETIDLGALAREIVALLDPPATARVTVADAMPTIRSPRAPLTQVLQNLIDNAIKHAAGAPVRIAVDARAAGAFVELSVTDDGPGIAPEQHDRIWGLFQTLHPSAESATSTGIGLALVRRLAESLGGRAWVESAVGEGASFRVLWPGLPGERTHGD